jgi:hypothetical protein
MRRIDAGWQAKLCLTDMHYLCRKNNVGSRTHSVPLNSVTTWNIFTGLGDQLLYDELQEGYQSRAGVIVLAVQPYQQ